MAALPPVPKVIRFDLFQTLSTNSRVRDRIFLQYSGTLNNADLTTILATMSSAWNTNMAPDLATTTTLTSIEGTDLSSNTSPQVVNSTAHSGQVATAATTDGLACVVKFKINRRYRGGHPRFYLGGLPQVDVLNGTQWTTATLGAISAAFSGFISTCVASPPAAVASLIHVNVSYFTGFTNKTFPSGRVHPVPTQRANPIVDAIVGYAINPNFASQRRRNMQNV